MRTAGRWIIGAMVAVATVAPASAEIAYFRIVGPGPELAWPTTEGRIVSVNVDDLGKDPLPIDTNSPLVPTSLPVSSLERVYPQLDAAGVPVAGLCFALSTELDMQWTTDGVVQLRIGGQQQVFTQLPARATAPFILNASGAGGASLALVYASDIRATCGYDMDDALDFGALKVIGGPLAGTHGGCCVAAAAAF